MRSICFVLLFTNVAIAQNFERAVKTRLNEQRNDQSDKAYFNKKFGPAIRILEFGKPIDLDGCEIDSAARMSRDAKHPETWALMQADAKKAGLMDSRRELLNIKDTGPTEWTPVGMKGKAIRVKYDNPRQQAQVRQFGMPGETWDKTFLMDRKGVIFAEFDSQHIRQTETTEAGQ